MSHNLIANLIAFGVDTDLVMQSMTKAAEEKAIERAAKAQNSKPTDDANFCKAASAFRSGAMTLIKVVQAQITVEKAKATPNPAILAELDTYSKAASTVLNAFATIAGKAAIASALAGVERAKVAAQAQIAGLAKDREIQSLKDKLAAAEGK